MIVIGTRIIAWKIVICLNLLRKSVFSKEIIIDFSLGSPYK